MQGNILGQSGSGKDVGILNIYQMLNTPAKKNGIWIKTDEQINDVFITDKNPISYKQLENAQIIPYHCKLVALDKSIFLVGCGLMAKSLYLYNTVTKTYEKMQDIPMNFHYGSAVLFNNYIYMFAIYSSNSSPGNEKNVYKFDIVNQIYTKLEDTPYPFTYGTAVVANNEIYLISFKTSGHENDIYKYNTESNTYTKVTTIPYDFGSTNNKINSAVAVGNNIFLFGGKSENIVNTYKYDTISNSFTKLANIPKEFTTGFYTTIMDNEIYIYVNDTVTYKYSIEKNKYKKLEKAPVSNLKAIGIETEIFLFRGDNNEYNEVYKYAPNFGIEKDNFLAIYTEQNLFNIENKIDFLNNIVRVYKSKNGAITIPESYITDGEQWNLLN